ncbi:GntR family transcriptional regulator [Streptomyces phaeofaciens]|uniref:GntR family transcriptional regulator n=1 Tax=Streptomyces phaeofaciens TaxID=68254 RepID=UPI00369DB281
MKQGMQGSAAPGIPQEGPGRPRVPAQSRAASAEGADRERCAPQGAVRGEHTHSETPVPRPDVPRPGVQRPDAPRPDLQSPGLQSPGLQRSGVERPDLQRPGGIPRPVVQRSSVRGQILDALRTALVTGELRPGEVYSAPVLGERFGVSATPVREAMQQLALEGAVEVVPNRGFRVVVRGTRELAELAEVRALIEVPVMLRLARTVPAERWADLRPLAEATVRAAAGGCRATYAEADRVFHRAVLALSGNDQLVGIAADLHRRSQWPLTGAATPRGRAELLADATDHLTLLDALTTGDLDTAQALVRDHFTA